ncbi:MAG: hypothetical protein DMF79_00145, partial [Acidobacteria bacterium]
PSGVGKLFGFARFDAQRPPWDPQETRSRGGIQVNTIQLTSLGQELSVSHLAGFLATVHWTTSFLA